MIDDIRNNPIYPNNKNQGFASTSSIILSLFGVKLILSLQENHGWHCGYQELSSDGVDGS